MMKKTVVADRWLALFFLLTALSGIKLHTVVERLSHGGAWAWLHGLTALAFTVAAGVHGGQHAAWYKALRRKTPTRRLLLRRAAVAVTDLLFLFLLASGAILLPASEGALPHLAMLHYAAGLAATAFGLQHIVKRRKSLLRSRVNGKV